MTSKWYALAVKPRKEQFVEQQLSALGVNAVCPRYTRIVSHARRKKRVLSPIFPGYLFVEIDVTQRSWRLVNAMPGSFGLLCFDNRPAPLEARFVNHFIDGIRDDGSTELTQSIQVGDRVQTLGGAFDRFSGEVIEMSEGDRVKVLMDALNRKVEMTLPRKTLIVAA